MDYAKQVVEYGYSEEIGSLGLNLSACGGLALCGQVEFGVVFSGDGDVHGYMSAGGTVAPSKNYEPSFTASPTGSLGSSTNGLTGFEGRSEVDGACVGEGRVGCIAVAHNDTLSMALK